MLRYKYISPILEPVTCYDCKKHDKCQRVIRGHSTKMLCGEREIHNKITISSNPEYEYNFILKDIWMMQNIIRKEQSKMMQEDIFPETLKSSFYEIPPASYTECQLYIELLDIFSKYIEDNKIPLTNDKDRMTKILQTTIKIKDNMISIDTSCKELKELLDYKIKEYKRYHITYLDSLVDKEKEK